MPDEKSPEWATALGAALIVLLVVSLTLIASGGWTWFAQFLQGTASGWAQALGGMMAVFAAFVIGNSQIQAGRKLELMRRAVESSHRAAVIDAISSQMMQTLSEMQNRIDKFKTPIFIHWNYADRIRTDVNALKAIHLLDCPTTKIIYSLTALPALAEGLISELEAYNAACDEGDRKKMQSKVDILWNGISVVQLLVDSIMSECKAEIKRTEPYLVE